MEEYYRTRDLAESASLIVNKMPLLRMEKEGNIYWFVFGNKEKCLELSNQYFFGELLLNAREFYEALTRLKNRIFSE